MPGVVPGIHVSFSGASKTVMAGTSARTHAQDALRALPGHDDEDTLGYSSSIEW
jgi:hypothetical protein